MLRPYQQLAVTSAYDYLRSQEGNPCIVIPTGGGKSYVLAQMAKDTVAWGGRCIILAHVKELLEQNADKIMKSGLQTDIGIYSAGLNSRDTDNPVIVAGIQSVYKRPKELGPFDLVIVDEAHMIPPDGEGMYQTYLKEAVKLRPHLRIIGLTATPYRMKSGLICDDGKLLNDICYDVSVKELILDGYLSKLISKAGAVEVDTKGLHVRYGEFIESEVEALMDNDEKVRPAVAEIVSKNQDRKACLIFCAGVSHARHVQEVFNSDHGCKSKLILGDTPAKERAGVIESFRNGKLKYLINVQVLTHGFDVPHVDCVALMRPTLSPGLYYQMVGRGFRKAKGKEDCLILDFGSNVERHGPVDCIRAHGSRKTETPQTENLGKICMYCRAVVELGYEHCPECGEAFPVRKRQINESESSDADILSGDKEEEHNVQETLYNLHTKEKDDGVNRGP